MAQATGTVGHISIKSRNTKRGAANVYSFVTKEQDGVWFNLGFNEPSFNKGDNITFNYVEGQYGNDVDTKSVRVNVGASPTTSAPAATGKPAASRGGSRDDYWSKKEEYDKSVTSHLIHLQSSRSNAVALCIAGLEQGILPIGSGKKEVKWDLFMELVNHTEQVLYDTLQEKREILEAGGTITSKNIKAEDAGYQDNGFEDDDLPEFN